MIDYNAYCAHANIKPRAVVTAVSAEFPKFSKIQFSMCSNPAYGVCLLPEAEELLVRQFGEGPGLLNVPPCHGEERGDAAIRASRPENRRKSNMFRVRLDDELAARVRALMTELHFTHVQDFLEQALLAMLENREVDA